MSRLRVFIRPFQTSAQSPVTRDEINEQMVEVTNDVIDVGSLKAGIQTEGFDVTSQRLSSMKIRVYNEGGRYSEGGSFFPTGTSRNNSLVRVTWQESPEDFICGYSICGVTSTVDKPTTVFEGILNGQTTTENLNKQTVDISVIDKLGFLRRQGYRGRGLNRSPSGAPLVNQVLDDLFVGSFRGNALVDSYLSGNEGSQYNIVIHSAFASLAIPNSDAIGELAFSGSRVRFIDIDFRENNANMLSAISSCTVLLGLLPYIRTRDQTLYLARLVERRPFFAEIPLEPNQLIQINAEDSDRGPEDVLEVTGFFSGEKRIKKFVEIGHFFISPDDSVSRTTVRNIGELIDTGEAPSFYSPSEPLDQSDNDSVLEIKTVARVVTFELSGVVGRPDTAGRQALKMAADEYVNEFTRKREIEIVVPISTDILFIDLTEVVSLGGVFKDSSGNVFERIGSFWRILSKDYDFSRDTCKLYLREVG